MSTGLARVTISAPRRRVDLALPEHLPLAELLPEVLRHAGMGLADDGERHGGWVLRRADGDPLHGGQALLGQGVRDGEVLHLVPARDHWPELEYDDVAEAIADGARRRGEPWGGRATRIAGLAGAGLLLAVGLLAVLAAGPGWGYGAGLALALAGLLTVGAVAASRAYGDAPVAATLGALAMPYAGVGAALVVTSADPVGPVAPLPWVGAAELLAGALAVLLVATLAAAGTGTGLRVFAAGAGVGLLGGVSAVAGMFLPPDDVAALLVAVLLGGIGVVPLLAIRLARLPMPPVTLPTGEAAAEGFGADIGDAGTGEGPDADGASQQPARERPDRHRVFAVVARADDLLVGLLTAVALLVTAAVGLLVVAHWTGRLLAAVAASILLLRCRAFVTVRQRLPLVAAALAATVALGVQLARTLDGAALMALVVGAAIMALTALATAATYAARPVSPYLGRAADIVDTLLVVSVVPVAAAVLGLYGRARGLLG